jgi:hypothetical protein
LGSLMADAVEGKSNPHLERFHCHDENSLQQGEGNTTQLYVQSNQ